MDSVHEKSFQFSILQNSLRPQANLFFVGFSGVANITHISFILIYKMSETTETSNKLAARAMASAVNTPELAAEHKRINGTKIRTRFPPEPNGYLHVGHCKSMCMNFELAFEKLGVDMENRETVFRYDDTNPEAESNEYIDSLREDVAWLGWKPVKTTYTSNYFQQLYEFAIQLIKEGKAYVCHQTKADIEECRTIAKAKAADPNAPGDPNSPWRNRPVEENLKLFDDMKKGKFASGECTLRLKMDMTSPNPNMWDQVAYRIKYVPHPHAGDAWCIYPTYDYTHCIIDSLEHIDYSICTLEFESRRESYFWVLEALNLYRPNVYEMSRLNLCYTMLSKRKLLKLVTSNYMRGWDDPRMPTIKGLRRRGYTPESLNAFCRDVGVTRNENMVQYERLEQMARVHLHEISPRLMGIISPVKVILTNFKKYLADMKLNELVITIPNFPHDPSRGSHTLKITPTEGETILYIDEADFREVDSDDFFGLSVNKHVGLKYLPFGLHCDSIKSKSDSMFELTCSCVYALENETPVAKPKGVIQWVNGATALSCEVRVYNHLFVTEDIKDDIWEEQLNPKSEVVHSHAFVDESLLTYDPKSEMHFQVRYVVSLIKYRILFCFAARS